jgi:hypothetical protein
MLDARTRSSIYEKLRPILGDDDANALMSQFPTTDADEPVTRQVLRAELADLRAELRIEMHDLGRRLVMWSTGSVIAGMGLAATVARLLG